MTQDQEQFLNQIIEAVVSSVARKHRTGQAEHGGDIWEKSGMLTNAEHEVADLVSYHYTIRHQVEKALDHLHDGDVDQATLILEKLVSPDCG